jgi:hypothetical protein
VDFIANLWWINIKEEVIRLIEAKEDNLYNYSSISKSFS